VTTASNAKLDLQAEFEFGRVVEIMASCSAIVASASVAFARIDLMVSMAAITEVSAIELSITSSMSDVAVSDARVTITVSVVNATHVVAVEDASNAAVSVVLWVVWLDILAVDLLEGFHRVSLMVCLFMCWFG
jgi:hypothetical protein